MEPHRNGRNALEQSPSTIKHWLKHTSLKDVSELQGLITSNVEEVSQGHVSDWRSPSHAVIKAAAHVALKFHTRLAHEDILYHDLKGHSVKIETPNTPSSFL